MVFGQNNQNTICQIIPILPMSRIMIDFPWYPAPCRYPIYNPVNQRIYKLFSPSGRVIYGIPSYYNVFCDNGRDIRLTAYWPQIDCYYYPIAVLPRFTLTAYLIDYFFQIPDIICIVYTLYIVCIVCNICIICNVYMLCILCILHILYMY